MRENINNLFDNCEYDIDVTDGSIEKYMAKVMAENTFAQVDSEGRQWSSQNLIRTIMEGLQENICRWSAKAGSAVESLLVSDPPLI